MDFVSIKELKDYTYKRSTLLTIEDLDLFLTMNYKLTPQQVFMSIVREALKKFEFYCPIFLINKVYIYKDDLYRFKFNSNFDLYKDGRISEDQIILIPRSIIGMSMSKDATASQLLRTFRYKSPYLYEFWYSPSVYYIHGLYSRPIIEEYEELSGEYTDRCGIYYFTWSEDSDFNAFLDQVYIEVCRYLLRMKGNMELSNMPIEIFGGLEQDYNDIKSELDQFYSNSANNGMWLK